MNWIASSSGNQTAALKPQSIKVGRTISDFRGSREIWNPLFVEESDMILIANHVLNQDGSGSLQRTFHDAMFVLGVK